ncbi:MAG: nucleotidyltransferase [Candidatus Delongbacteria bacterium]|nr:nucleotidyltransferase [Candidatus Delongbacteria bacterium]
MNIQQDFRELLRLLEKNKVDYVIVGGYAVAFYGYPRFTKDIDIFFKDSKENIIDLLAALKEFGFTEDDINENMFQTKGNIVTFGVEPVRVDFLNSIDGVSFDEAVQNKVRGKYDTVEVYFIGKEELIKNKLSTDRLQDKADVEELTK